MQSRTRCKLHFRLAISLLLSISVSSILILITNERRNLYFSSDTLSNISDEIVLFVRTSHNCQSRLIYLLQSWIPSNLSKQSNLYLLTDEITNSTNLTMLNSFRNVIETKCPQTHDRLDLCCKTAHEFDLFYKLTKSKSHLQWMCRFDDDQYVNTDNLYEYLSKLNSSKPHYIGRTSINGRLKVADDNRTFIFATYGAGVCFSRALLEKLRPYTRTKSLPNRCVKRGLSDDAYIGYLTELVVNTSLTSINDLLHSHLEKLDQSFRYYNLDNLSRSITFGFAWDRYKLDWLPIIHQLVKLVKQGQVEAANRLWLFLRNYEKDHPEDLKDQYDQSCVSYQRLRNQTIELQNKKNKNNSHNVKNIIQKN